MALFPLLQFICDHPVNQRRKIGALLDFFVWQVRSRLTGERVVYHWINGIRVSVQHGETGFTMNIYCGLQDFAEMAYLLHVLREDDLFVDVGANIGSYTLLASGVRKAQTICFEPAAATFNRLNQNLLLNNLGERVTPQPVGVGEKSGSLRFSIGENCCNHVLGHNDGKKGIDIQIVTLDEALAGNNPSLLKIDVEGFELPVLRGARTILQDPGLHSIILETSGGGSQANQYGYCESDIVNLLKEHGFASFRYDPFTRQLAHSEPTYGNSLFIRGSNRVQTLVQASESFQIKNLDL